MNSLTLGIGAAAVVCGAVAMASGNVDEGRMPDLDGAVNWLNSAPLSDKALRGKVVLVKFLDVLVHQLLAGVALHEGVGGEV
jgi:hypothetical protein